jgi:hypothetical protein
MLLSILNAMIENASEEGAREREREGQHGNECFDWDSGRARHVKMKSKR